jgi:two-component system sensor histidine kinase/response regulator
MTTQLRGLYERMEQKVADRTAELTEANEQLTSEIAERKRIEAQLWQAKEDAEAANRAKSAFLANMSHELRTPLSAIIGFAQLLQRHQATPREHQEYLHIMTRSSEHLRDLINGVLDMSKIEAGRITLDTTEVDLQFVLDEITAMFRLRASEKSLTLRLERAPDVPSHLATDEGKLRQILINLVGNAIKFTHEGHIIIRVSLAGAATARPLLHIEVEDSGPGIASEDSEQVFSPFYQTAATRNHAQGTGLGLPISRQYARLMGGDIILESKEGVGSTFRLVLPLAVSAPDEPPGSATTEEQPQQRVVGIAAGEPTYRILVAEDSDNGRLLLVDLLESVGFAVRGVPDGKACVEQWAAWQPHLIWMDIRMPGMDGFEATRRIKSSEQGQQTVIIALTASAFEEDRARILAAGCDDFVRKPFRDSDIFEHMAKHLGVQYQYELVEPVLQENSYPV